ncbi:MAG: hypothetical protein ABIK83_16485 [Candidatus Zixiibacteriota bacterium]
MKSHSQLIVAAFALMAIFSFILISCSDDNLGYPAASSKTLAGDADEIGPPDGGGDDPEFWNLNLMFDVDEPVLTTTNEKIIGTAGGTVIVYLDGHDRTVTFPSGFMLADEIVSVSASKGVNKMGQHLEIYEFTPISIALFGAFQLGIETDIESPSAYSTKAKFTLYRLVEDKYYEVTTGLPNSQGVVEFELRSSMTFAVIYEISTAPSDFNLS